MPNWASFWRKGTGKIKVVNTCLPLGEVLDALLLPWKLLWEKGVLDHLPGMHIISTCWLLPTSIPRTTGASSVIKPRTFHSTGLKGQDPNTWGRSHWLSMQVSRFYCVPLWRRTEDLCQLSLKDLSALIERSLFHNVLWASPEVVLSQIRIMDM